MRYVRLFLILGLLVGMAGMGTAMAASNVNVPLSVQIAQELDLSYYVYLGFSATNTLDTSIPYSSMAFGPLRYNKENGWWAPDTYFCVFLTARTSNRPYTITMSPLSGFTIGGIDISKKVIVTPGYYGGDLFTWPGGGFVAQDDATSGAGPLATDAQIGGYSLTDTANVVSVEVTSGGKHTHYEARPSIATQPRTIYKSGASDGQSRIVRCYVGFYTADPIMTAKWKGIPVSGATQDKATDVLLLDKDLKGISWGGKTTLSSASGAQLTYTVTLN